MIIPRQYPHKLVVFTRTASIDEDGNPVAENISIVFEGKCRIEVNTKNQFITGNDGKQIYYNACIYYPLPKQLGILVGHYFNCTIPNMDTNISGGITVTDTYHVDTSIDNSVNISGEILSVDKGSQLNNRIWV